MSGMTGSRPTADAPWTTRRLQQWMAGYFEQRGIESPHLVADMLLAHVLDCERMRLYMEVDRPTDKSELARLRDLVRRASGHEPAQYLVGEAWFFSRPFHVDRSTMIPRPSTETLVEYVIQWLRNEPGHDAPLFADVGTGTGCIAISLLAQFDAARAVATDVSGDALDLAARNAERHGVADRIEFRAGDLLDPLRDHPLWGTFDVICSNPPYIPDHEWAGVAPNVRDYEPHTALRGGVDGLDFIRPLLAGAGAGLRTGGRLVVELADSHHEQAADLVRHAADLKLIDVLKDHEGLHRVVVAEAAR